LAAELVFTGKLLFTALCKAVAKEPWLFSLPPAEEIGFAN
jgi:hypothetical protein